jgi:formylglycine-generating enzyme required for sulfatase activity
MRYPIDESPFGVFDMSGNAAEWTVDAAVPGPGRRRLAGGSWARAGPEGMFFITGGLYLSKEDVFTECGFRLVWRETPP